MSTKLVASAAIGGGGSFAVSMNYGRRSSCIAGASHKSYNDLNRCPHYHSNTIILKAGDLIGPGALVASSAASGDYAVASAAGSVKFPQDALIRVTSSPSQNVHVAWAATCSKGVQVASRSSSYDTDSPDSTPIDLPLGARLFDPPDSCTISVTAQLDESGDLSIRVYAHAGK